MKSLSFALQDAGLRLKLSQRIGPIIVVGASHVTALSPLDVIKSKINLMVTW